MEEESVQVEETTEVSQPEGNAEETEAPIEETQEQSSEETETTAEVETEVAPEPKVSRANERIRELVAQKKELEAQLKSREPEPQIEGVDADGIDPNRFAESLIKKAESAADRKYSYNRQIDEATQKFPEVANNDLVGTRATALMSEGYTPVQAAEIATLEWRDQLEKATKQSAQRQQAGEKMRQEASITSAGKSTPQTSGMFTRSEIAKMSPAEYQKNAKAIHAQLEKYGAESLED